MGYSETDQGEKFDLAANGLPGGPYTNNITDSQLHDGTSDGSYNYSVDYTTGDVLQFDRDWAGPSTIFNATADLPDAGWIKMNATDGTFSSTGTLLGSFNSGVFGSLGLALDPADGTLWMGDSSFNLHQFSQAGALLQSVPYSLAGSWYGMEFDTTPIPEPSSLALAAIALVGFSAWRWRTAGARGDRCAFERMCRVCSRLTA